MIRVGRCTYDNKYKRIDPKYDGFTNILVLTKSSPYGSLGPYVLKNEKGQIMENIWQFSKIYEEIPTSVQKYSRYDSTIIWTQKKETHVKNNMLTKEYWQWREKGYNNEYAVRYPNGFGKQHNCVGAYYNTSEPNKNDKYFEVFDETKSSKLFEKTQNIKILEYVQARKAIYLPVYCEMVKKETQFKELQEKLQKGENLLIIEVDGPHQESLGHYKTKYKVKDDFIVNNTMLITQENIQIMLNDPKHPFGHGYCLAMALLGKDVEWNL